MCRMCWRVVAIALLSASALGQDGQSLADIARASREKQQAQEATGVVPKVITNKDLPASQPTGIPEANPADPMTMVSGVQRTYRDQPYQQFGERSALGGERGGGNLRGKIQDQEMRVAELQSRVDRANARMHPTGSRAQFEGPTNRYQAMQAQRLETMQQMLDQQKQRLAMMQDEARRQGMHTTVTDP